MHKQNFTVNILVFNLSVAIIKSKKKNNNNNNKPVINLHIIFFLLPLTTIAINNYPFSFSSWTFLVNMYRVQRTKEYHLLQYLSGKEEALNSMSHKCITNSLDVSSHFFVDFL